MAFLLCGSNYRILFPLEWGGESPGATVWPCGAFPTPLGPPAGSCGCGRLCCPLQVGEEATILSANLPVWLSRVPRLLSESCPPLGSHCQPSGRWVRQQLPQPHRTRRWGQSRAARQPGQDAHWRQRLGPAFPPLCVGILAEGHAPQGHIRVSPVLRWVLLQRGGAEAPCVRGGDGGASRSRTRRMSDVPPTLQVTPGRM